MGKLAHFFLDVDMRAGHPGLMKLIAKQKVTLKEGEFFVFLNKRRDTIKMFCGNQWTLMHYRNTKSVVDPGIIRHLPTYAGGQDMNVPAALRDYLNETLARKKSQ